MASKHPRGLYVLFFTEMWERFGFYLMLALFTLYLTEHLKMTEAEASSIYGGYMFFVYLTPFFGGLLADRIFGYTRAILSGAALLGAGYLVFSIQNQTAFYAALFLMIIGNGLFKPNISTLVGNLYPQGDSRRDSAFSIFYMGINLGALFAGPGGRVHAHQVWLVAGVCDGWRGHGLFLCDLCGAAQACHARRYPLVGGCGAGYAATSRVRRPS
jgi:amino acid/peptide:H+ symporter